MARNVFNSVAVRKPSRNTFNLSHDIKFSGDMGELIPILCEEVLPGDVWRFRSETLVRLAPMVAPVMHRVNINVEYFFVPNRIIWPNWEAFISPPEDGSTPPAHPFFSLSGVSVPVGSLGDYLGLPTGVTGLGEFNALPFYAYAKIWNEYYRDQNLQSRIADTAINGSNNNNGSNNVVYTIVNGPVKRRAWQHDYFTGSLPFAQKGQPVNIPIGFDKDAPVYQLNNSATGSRSWASNPNTAGITTTRVREKVDSNAGLDNTFLFAQTSGLTQSSGTINDLRIAMRTQEFLERQARGGSRYIEQIRMQFGVKSSDQRLQRPEFIGSTRSPIVISEVLQTSESGDTPLAEMAGHGIGAQSGKYFRYYAEEHGWIFAMLSITPKTAYYQGVPKKFLRSDMFDYAWPVLAHIGEQEVLNKEIYVANDGKNDDTFGYVPRYSEYRFIPSYVRGEMRTSLNFWHMARDFSSRPTLSGSFVECNPTKRIFAVTDANVDSLWMHAFHSIKCSRLLPKYGTPTL